MLPSPEQFSSQMKKMGIGDGTLKPAAEMKKIFEQAGIDLSKPVSNTCGSGVMASILALALAIIGHRHVSVYDGSWSEWGADESLPISP